MRMERRQEPEARTSVITQPAPPVYESCVHIEDVLARVVVTMTILRRDAEHNGVVNSLRNAWR
jgi:hypothetical protein